MIVKMKPAYLIAALAIGLVACTSSPVADESPVETPTPQAELLELPPGIPGDTQLLIRAGEEQFKEVMLEIRSLYRQNHPYADSYGYDQRDMEAELVDYFAQILKEFLVAEPQHWDEPLNMVGFRGDENSFAALRPTTQAPLLEAMRWGAPLVAETPPAPDFSIRLFLPSDDPEGLIAEIGRFCDLDRIDCAGLLDTSWQEEYAIIDLLASQRHVDDFEERDLFFPVEEEAAFQDRQTPALKTFLDSDHHGAVYFPDFVFVDWAAVMSLSELRFMLFFDPDGPYRNLLFASGFEIMSTLGLDSPQTQEIEDLTITLGSASHPGVTATIATTHTPMGQSIYQAGGLDLELPAVAAAEPALEFDWSADLDAAIDATLRPDWMTVDDVEDHDLFHYGEIWTLLGTFFAHPMGVLQWADQWFHKEYEEEEDQPFALLRGIHGVRARVGFFPAPELAVGYRLDGGIAVAVQPGSQAAAQLEKMIDDLDQMGLIDQFNLAVTETVVQGMDVLLLSDADLDNPFGDPTPVQEFHLISYPERVPSRLFSHLHGELAFLSQVMPQFSIAMDTSMMGRTVEFQFGETDGTVPRVADSEVTLRQRPAPPECMQRARALAEKFKDEPLIHDILYNVDLDEDNFDDVLEEVRQEFRALRDECDHDELDAVVDAWEAVEIDLESADLDEDYLYDKQPQGGQEPF